MKHINLKVCLENLAKKSTKLRSYTGHQLPVKGTRNIQCNVKGQNYNVKFHIVELESETLLGGESALQMKLIKRVNSVNPDEIETKQCPTNPLPRARGATDFFHWVTEIFQLTPAGLL